MPRLTRITIYPIKSLDGYAVDAADLMPTGPIVGDRRWAIVDPMRQFVNGKRTPALHLIRATFGNDATTVSLHHPNLESLNCELPGNVDRAGEWLSEALGRKCMLIENQAIGFPDDADASGPTLVSVRSLERVAEWFGLELDEVRRRFRTNLEIDAPEPFWEDRLVATDTGPTPFALGDVLLRGRTPCQRCAVPSRDSLTGEIIPGFAKAFSAHRQAELPAWAPADAFNHFYRLTLNTSLDPTNAGAMTIRLGDELRVTA